jgi:hypothetical protein
MDCPLVVKRVIRLARTNEWVYKPGAGESLGSSIRTAKLVQPESEGRSFAALGSMPPSVAYCGPCNSGCGPEGCRFEFSQGYSRPTPFRRGGFSSLHCRFLRTARACWFGHGITHQEGRSRESCLVAHAPSVVSPGAACRPVGLSRIGSLSPSGLQPLRPPDPTGVDRGLPRPPRRCATGGFH